MASITKRKQHLRNLNIRVQCRVRASYFRNSQVLQEVHEHLRKCGVHAEIRRALKMKLFREPKLPEAHPDDETHSGRETESFRSVPLLSGDLYTTLNVEQFCEQSRLKRALERPGKADFRVAYCVSHLEPRLCHESHAERHVLQQTIQSRHTNQSRLDSRTVFALGARATTCHVLWRSGNSG